MKMRIQHIFLFLFISTSSLTIAATDIIGEKVIPLKNSNGQAQVLTRAVEGKLGLPYAVEIRVSCGSGRVDNWETLEVKDSESVCDVKPKSAKITSDGKNISVLIRETDAEAFNEQTKMVKGSDLGKLRPVCQKLAKEFLFSVDDYCR
ncbi:hypothetical protein D3C87_190380 [compost metagenome]